MCSPFEWLMVAATAVQTVGKMDQADQIEQDAALRREEAAQEATERRQMGEFQAQQAEADAAAEREAGEVRASKVRRLGKTTQSEAKAALAASGVEVGAGTPVRIDYEIRRRYELDAAQEILLGTRKGARLDQEAALARQSGHRGAVGVERGAAAADRAAARAADSARLSGFSSLLSGGAQIAKGWKTVREPRDTSNDFLYDSYDDGAVRIV